MVGTNENIDREATMNIEFYFKKTCALIGLASYLFAISMAVTAAEDSVDNPRVIIKTTDGDIVIELYAEKSPVTVENFLQYVDAGYYNNTVFHRVISNFMIQGGGFSTEMKEKPTRDPIINESSNKLHNTRGTLAMARTSDPDSATAQFFINQRSNLRLDWTPGNEGYAVFGEVVEGMQVVDIIALTETGATSVETSRGPAVFQDVPVTPIVLLSVSRMAP
jgi:cyclophilin family peptidyl-prolyl cis-trans isomerase|tara:strand:- start:9152 stop:9814 length:663 start_codon:yes stop_codon:yes gene_type:complete